MMQGEKVKNFDLVGIALVALAGLEAVMFMFFTGDFLCEQLESVKDAQTVVESYQFKRGVTMTVDQNFISVFGKNSWLWLAPVAPDLDVDYEELVIIDNEESYQVKDKKQ